VTSATFGIGSVGTSMPVIHGPCNEIA